MLSQVINTGPFRANRRLRTLLCLYTFVNCNMPATIYMNFCNIRPEEVSHQPTSLEGMSCSTMPSSLSPLLHLQSKPHKSPRSSPFISANFASVRKPFQFFLSDNPDHIQLLLYRNPLGHQERSPFICQKKKTRA
ncbi:hypothetical protein GGI43DRAFT_352756 [Trichoderma evansii]